VSTNPLQIGPLQGRIQKAISQLFAPPLRGPSQEGCAQLGAHWLQERAQQQPKTAHRPIARGATPHGCELFLANVLADELAGLPPLPEGHPDWVRRLAGQHQVHEQPRLSKVGALVQGI
jgi:hypothetical protein